MKNTLIIIATASLATALLAVPVAGQTGEEVAGQSVEEIELAVEGVKLEALPPGMEREYHVGDRINVVHHGEKAYHEVIAVKDGFVSFRASYGCEWRKQDLFSPPVEWSNCDGGSGTQEILSREGSPWPLRAGKTFSYTVKGSDTRGNTWETVQSCYVEGLYSISIRTGEHKTYKVVCDDDWLHQIWYWSPVLREYVKYLRDHSEEPEICDVDMIGAPPVTGKSKAPFSVESLFKNRIAN